MTWHIDEKFKIWSAFPVEIARDPASGVYHIRFDVSAVAGWSDGGGNGARALATGLTLGPYRTRRAAIEVRDGLPKIGIGQFWDGLKMSKGLFLDGQPVFQCSSNEKALLIMHRLLVVSDAVTLFSALGRIAELTDIVSKCDELGDDGLREVFVDACDKLRESLVLPDGVDWPRRHDVAAKLPADMHH